MVLECLGEIIMAAEIKESSECGGWWWSLCPLKGIVSIKVDSLTIL